MSDRLQFVSSDMETNGSRNAEPAIVDQQLEPTGAIASNHTPIDRRIERA
jgi:hypothetical protein